VLAVYHNITPPSLVTTTKARESIDASLEQKHNLVAAGCIICDSEHNRDDLIAFGIEPERLVVHHLPPARRALARSAAEPGGPVELVYIGRLVRAKGVLDLLDASEALAARDVADFRVHLVGSPSFSEPEMLSQARYRAALVPQIHFDGELEDDAVAELMSRADALVVPSYHEGYCVPVIEAYAAGCQVVAYDSTNLPNVLGHLGQLVGTGDVRALTDALEAVVTARAAARAGEPDMVPTTSGPRPVDEWTAAVAAHLAAHSQETYDAAFLDVLADAAATAPMAAAGVPS
jgi:glycosyltransferase involved in cell wall biosynthesis